MKVNRISISKVIITIVASIVILSVTQIASQLIAELLLIIKIPAFICNIFGGGVYIVLSYVLLKLLCEKYLKSDLVNYSIPKPKIKVKWLVIAILLPILVSGFYFVLGGEIRNSNMDTSAILDTLSVGVFFTGLGAGIVEEMVFRGVILNVINQRFGKRIAIIVPSLLFGSMHIIGTEFNVFSAILVITAGTLVGVMFSLVSLDQKSIWNSALIHGMWNIIMIGGIVSINTTVDEYSIYSYVLHNQSVFLTGGEFGIESSGIAMIGYILVIIIAYRSIHKKSCQ